MFANLYIKHASGSSANNGKFRNFSYNKRQASNSPISDTIQITIRNTTAQPQTVNILSARQPTGVVIAANTISMEGLRTSVLANPMQVSSMKINATNADQLNNPVQLVYSNPLGANESSIITPSAYSNSFQTNAKMVEIPNVNAVLDVSSSIQTVVNPGVTLIFVFKVKMLFNSQKDYNRYTNFVEAKKYRSFMRCCNI